MERNFGRCERGGVGSIRPIIMSANDFLGIPNLSLHNNNNSKINLLTLTLNFLNFGSPNNLFRQWIVSEIQHRRCAVPVGSPGTPYPPPTAAPPGGGDRWWDLRCRVHKKFFWRVRMCCSALRGVGNGYHGFSKVGQKGQQREPIGTIRNPLLIGFV